MEELEKELENLRIQLQEVDEAKESAENKLQVAVERVNPVGGKCSFNLKYCLLLSLIRLDFIQTTNIIRFANEMQACPWECRSYGNPMGNVPWDGTAHICISHETQK